MKKLTLLFFLTMLANYKLYSDVLPPISFYGGVRYDIDCKDIEDGGACDSSNFLSDRQGSVETRYGSKALIPQSVSTQPFTSMFRTYIASGSQFTPVFIGVSGNNIYYSTQVNITELRVLYSSLTTPNQIFSFAVANNDIYMTGSALTDPIYRWRVNASSFAPAFLGVTFSSGAVFFAKYILWDRDYMIAANIRDVKDGLTVSTTYYDDLAMYSLQTYPSSFTYTRKLNFNIGDGEYLSGLTKKFGRVNLQKPSSIWELNWTNRLDPIAEGGDQEISQLADGFGHISDYPPENTGDFDVLFSKNGVLLLDGGRRARTSLSEENINISRDIRPLIQTIVKNKTYRNTAFKYYPKLQQIVMSYEHPERFPKGRQNSVIVYDLILNKWYPYKNWTASSFVVFGGFRDDGVLAYGDSIDGRIILTDQKTESDDERQVLSIDNCDSSFGWIGSTVTSEQVVEGSSSLKISSFETGVSFTSMSKLGTFILGEWNDKTKALKENTNLSFKVYCDSISIIRNIRVDLLVEDTLSGFNINHSSVVISSNSLTLGSTRWNTVEVTLSSFPVKREWYLDLSSESFPFAKSMTYFGIRISAELLRATTIYIDDIRLVGKDKNPLNPFYLTKQWNFQNIADKEPRQVVITREKQRDSNYFVDVFTGIKNLKQTKEVKAEIPKEFYVGDFNGQNGLTKFDIRNLQILKSTQSGNVSQLDFMNGTADNEFVYTFEQVSKKLYKFNRNDISSPTLTFGSFGLGQGSTYFGMVHDMSVDKKSDGNLYTLDNQNNNIKVYRKKDFIPVFNFGTLGSGATSLHSPTGIDHDSQRVYVGDDGNQRIAIFSNNFSSFILKAEAQIDDNTIGDISVRVDEEFLYDSYNKINEQFSFYQDIVLERRNKSDGSLINRIVVKPKDDISLSTYTFYPPIALIGNYVLISFSKDPENTEVFIQKRLKENFDLVDEVKTNRQQFGIIADGLSREPLANQDKIDLEVSPSNYIQFKIYANSLDNRIKLKNLSHILEPKQYREGSD